MVCRCRVGHMGGSSAGGKSRARYYLDSDKLTVTASNELATYYVSEQEPLSALDILGTQIADGEISFSEALDELMRQEVAISGPATDLDEVEWRVASALAEAAGRAELRDSMVSESQTAAMPRPDMSPAMAALLGIDRQRPLLEAEFGNLINGFRTDGAPIEGRVEAKAILSVAEVFGITDNKAPPTGEAFDNIMSGRRIDGSAPITAKGEPIEDRLVAGARRRFLTAMHLPHGREPTADETARMRTGIAALEGMIVNPGEYRHAIRATKEPIAHLELTFSADKSLSVAWALAVTEAERALLYRCHTDAIASVLAYAEEVIGFRQRGARGERAWEEKGEIPWIVVQHFCARPVAEVAAIDKDGVAYTEFKEVARQADPHLHAHVILPSVVLTSDGVGKINMDRLDGKIHELGGVYHAKIAANARRLGIDIALGKVGEERLTAVPESIRTAFSRRSVDGQIAAQELAKAGGEDWDALTPTRKLALLEKARVEHREAKRDGPTDFEQWRRLAKNEMGYEHRSVLRPDEVKPELTTAQRREAAYKASLPLVEEAFAKNSTLSGEDLRILAVQGFLKAGCIGDDPGSDIAAVTNAYRKVGIQQDGEMVPLVWGRSAPVRGMERWVVSTGLNLSHEQQVITLAKTAAEDRTAALSPKQIKRAAADFLKRRPDIDPESAQWKTQQAMMTRLATSGRLAVGIGSAGAGKSTILSPLVDAWRADGRKVYGIAVAWRQAGGLADSGIAKEDRAAVAAFMKRVADGKYTLDRKSVVVVDELSQISSKAALDLLKLQEKHGFQLVMIGDPRQTASVEAGAIVELMEKALPGAIPEIITSIRQRTEREREITQIFRSGDAADAIAMKREDKTIELVAGGRIATVQRVANLWRERMEANKDNPDFTLSVLTGTRADARDISAAIRGQLQAEGKIGADVVVVKAQDNAGDRYDMAIAPGDQIMALRRVYFSHRGMIANNGDVVTVLNVSQDGMNVRNADGQEAYLEWKVLSDNGGPIRIAPAFAQTIDSAQGRTDTESISGFISGTGRITGFKAYVAASRHTTANWIVISEAEERRQIASKQPIGDFPPITNADIWTSVARNLSRMTERQSAIESMKLATSVQTGTLNDRFVAAEPKERRNGPVWTASMSMQQQRQAEAPAIVEMVRELASTVAARMHPERRQHGPRM